MEKIIASGKGDKYHHYILPHIHTFTWHSMMLPDVWRIFCHEFRVCPFVIDKLIVSIFIFSQAMNFIFAHTFVDKDTHIRYHCFWFVKYLIYFETSCNDLNAQYSVLVQNQSNENTCFMCVDTL